jgi:hypothetical protein
LFGILHIRHEGPEPQRVCEGGGTIERKAEGEMRQGKNITIVVVKERNSAEGKILERKV